MNNKGQVLIIFIIIIPLLLILAAIVVDFGIVLKEKSRLKSNTKIIIKDALNENLGESEIKDLLRENDINIDNIKISVSDNKVTIKNEYEINSVFGNIIGIKKYTIKVNISGTLNSEKIIIKEE